MRNRADGSLETLVLAKWRKILKVKNVVLLNITRIVLNHVAKGDITEFNSVKRLIRAVCVNEMTFGKVDLI